MWNNDFAQEIFQSLEHLPGLYTNLCFIGRYNGSFYFVKKIVPRSNESIEIAQERIEITERISQFFNDHGINTVVAVCFNGSFTHCVPTGLWVAYPWIDAEPIETIDTTICYKIGQLLAKIHSIPTRFEFRNASNTYRRPDFAWRMKLMNTSDSRLIPFLLAFSEIEWYAEWGYDCAERLLQSGIKVLSHGDLHTKNILRQNDSLVFIDWELSGSINPDEELLDVALNLCGFLEYKTDLKLFDSIIRGYCSVIHLAGRTAQTDLAMGVIFLAIIEHMSYYLNRYISTGVYEDLAEACRFMEQFWELKKHLWSFREVIVRCINGR